MSRSTAVAGARAAAAAESAATREDRLAPKASERCRHCALPLSPGAREFCCTGCRLVHALAAGESDAGGPAPDRLLSRVVLAAFLSMGVMVFTLSLYGLDGASEGSGGETEEALRGLFRLGALAFSLPVLALLGPPLVAALRAGGSWRSADGLVLVGVAAAWCVSLWNTFTGGPGVYFETATLVLVLVSLGRWLEVRTRESARGRLAELLPAREVPAALLEGQLERAVAARELRAGDLVRLRPGDVVPADGRVEAGRSFLDESSLTGEERPRSVGPGDRVLDGTFLVDGTLDVLIERETASSTRAELERLFADSLARRPTLVRTTDRVAGAFLPLVLAVAVGTAVAHYRSAGLEPALLNALSVLLISCPCALGLATPLAFWSTLGSAWRAGILVRGGDVLERLARTRRVFLDKTGTLTTGELELVGLEILTPPEEGLERGGVLRLAAAVERGSEHPVARALRRLADGGDPLGVDEFRRLPGRGVEARVDGRTHSLVADARSSRGETTDVRLEREGRPLARLSFAARLRPEVPEVIAALRARGLSPTVLTGDGPGPARALERRLGLPVEATLLPRDKVRRLAEAGPRGVVFAGDGVNDVAALAAADVGVAVRGAAPGSLARASVALLRRDLRALPALVDSARHAVRRARGNLAFAFAYNVLGITLAAAGRLSPVFAGAAMVVSSALVCLNARRERGLAGGRLA